jgi:hypothetical protein
MKKFGVLYVDREFVSITPQMDKSRTRHDESPPSKNVARIQAAQVIAPTTAGSRLSMTSQDLHDINYGPTPLR